MSFGIVSRFLSHTQEWEDRGNEVGYTQLCWLKLLYIWPQKTTCTSMKLSQSQENIRHTYKEGAGDWLKVNLLNKHQKSSGEQWKREQTREGAGTAAGFQGRKRPFRKHKWRETLLLDEEQTENPPRCSGCRQAEQVLTNLVKTNI